MSRWKFLPEKIAARTRRALQRAVVSRTSVTELEPVGLATCYVNVLTEQLHVFTIGQLLALDPNDILAIKGRGSVMLNSIKQALLRFSEHDTSTVRFLENMMPNLSDLYLLRLESLNNPNP